MVKNAGTTSNATGITFSKTIQTIESYIPNCFLVIILKETMIMSHNFDVCSLKVLIHLLGNFIGCPKALLQI